MNKILQNVATASLAQFSLSDTMILIYTGGVSCHLLQLHCHHHHIELRYAGPHGRSNCRDIHHQENQPYS